MTRYLYRRMNRELRKVKFRAAGSIVLVMIAVATYVSMVSMMPSTNLNMEQKVDELGLSDYTVHVYSSNESALSGIRSIGGVAEAEYRLAVQKRMRYWVGDTAQDFSATLIGIEPGSMPQVNRFEMREGDGRYFQGGGNGTAIVEKGFAVAKGLNPGGRMEVLTDSGYVNVTVAGRAFSPEFIFMAINLQSVIPLPGTLAVVYLPIDWVRANCGFGSDTVNEFTMLFEEGRDHAALRAQVDAVLAPAYVIYGIPKEQNYGYALIRQDLESGGEFSGVLAFMILLVAFFVVYSSFTRIVQEQRREIGVLRALGYSRVSVMGSYIYMAFLLGLVGSVIGILISFPIGRGLTDFYIDMVVHTGATSFTLSADAAVAGLVFGPLTAMLACGIAVWGTVSMEPQAAIKGMHHKAARGKARRERRVRPGGRGHGLSYITLYTLRNVSRHRSRTAFTVVAISFAITLGSMPILIIPSWSNSMTRAVRDYEHWDLVVDYRAPLNGTTAAAVAHPGIVDSLQISKVLLSWRAGGKSGRALAIGFDMNQTLHTFSIASGRVARGTGEVMIGYITSNDNGLRTGDAVEVETPSGYSTLSIVAVVEDLLGEMFLDLPAMQRMTGLVTFSGMYVETAAGRTAEVREALLANPLVADVRYRDTVQSGMIELMSSYTALLYIFALFGVTISTITIANIVFVGVLERYYEYGQLRAVGYSRGSISKTILIEILLLIAISAVVAVPLSYLTIEAIAPEYKAFWPIYRTTLYLQDWAGFLNVVGLTFLFGLLAALPGMRYVGKMDLAKTVSGGQFG